MAESYGIQMKNYNEFQKERIKGYKKYKAIRGDFCKKMIKFVELI